MTFFKLKNSGFVARLTQRPAYIDPGICTGCGLCLERCPLADQEAVRKPPFAGDTPRLAVDPKVCVYFRDRKCTLCRDVCPEGAIDFNREPEEIEIEAQAVVAATGFEVFPAGKKTRYGYGVVDNVITAFDLERELRRTGRIVRPTDGQAPEKVAFIQCVGSRERQGHNYCSRVCCAYALRLGRVMRHRFGASVTIFYMDLQSFGHAFDEFLSASREELDLIRAMPGDVMPGADGRIVINYQPVSGQKVEQAEFDLLVLSVGLTPGSDSAETARLLEVDLDEHGFLKGAGPGADNDWRPGVFLAGTAVRPMDVAEAVAHARRAVEETIRYLEEN